jgi:WNK lysine deficient protein kinase
MGAASEGHGHQEEEEEEDQQQEEGQIDKQNEEGVVEDQSQHQPTPLSIAPAPSATGLQLSHPAMMQPLPPPQFSPPPMPFGSDLGPMPTRSFFGQHLQQPRPCRATMQPPPQQQQPQQQPQQQLQQQPQQQPQQQSQQQPQQQPQQHLRRDGLGAVLGPFQRGGRARRRA